MSIPPNQILQAALLAQFPAHVVADDGISINRQNGVYTFSWKMDDFNTIAVISAGDLDNYFLPLWNDSNALVPFNKMSVGDFITQAVTSIIAATTNPEPTQVTTSPYVVGNSVRNLAIVRGPGTTALTLPAVAARNSIPLRVFDWSPGILGVPGAEHVITSTPNGAETIMRGATHAIVSNEAGLATQEYKPSTTLAGWYI